MASTRMTELRVTKCGERMHAWVVDYSEARARAIAWLGDRYLLARPVKRRRAGEPRNRALPVISCNESSLLVCDGDARIRAPEAPDS